MRQLDLGVALHMHICTYWHKLVPRSVVFRVLAAAGKPSNSTL